MTGGWRFACLRLGLCAIFALALGWAQFRASGLDDLVAWLELSTVDGSGSPMPARVYLFKDGRPFRLSPVGALLPLKPDLFYRERLWRSTPEIPATLEVTALDQSHFILLNGRARFSLPQGSYRIEAYRGIFHKPAEENFSLTAGKTHTATLRLEPVDRLNTYFAGDDHIHLTRSRQDNDVFLRWLEAEDLQVGNFLQLQRQMDAAVQYAFGPQGEARGPRTVIRSGHESRSQHYGHVNFLGGREIIRPLSIDTIYANSPAAYPFPAILFEQGRKLGATVGYAHFEGSQPHSTLLMDLALGAIDFVEVFQFGVLKTAPWYQLLNAGLRVTGIAGSDFPVPLNRQTPWPRAIPLLGPERTLVPAGTGGSVYDQWAEGVRRGKVVVSNGPLIDFNVNSMPPGAVVDFTGNSVEIVASARASCYRPLVKIEIVVNGQVVDSRAGESSITFRAPIRESSWIAARVEAVRKNGEPEIRAHTNPVYVLRNKQPVRVLGDHAAVRAQWEKELAYYRTAALPFASAAEREDLIRRGEAALERLR